MATLSRADVEHVAHLARLGLTDVELTRLEGQLNHILDQYAVLAELHTDDIPPTAQTIELQNILRADVVTSSLSQESALANASDVGLTAGFYGGADEVEWFHEHIEAGVTYANRAQGATTGAWPGYQPFGGWKGSGSTGKAIASFYYLPLYLREQSRTVVR